MRNITPEPDADDFFAQIEKQAVRGKSILHILFAISSVLATIDFIVTIVTLADQGLIIFVAVFTSIVKNALWLEYLYRHYKGLYAMKRIRTVIAGVAFMPLVIFQGVALNIWLPLVLVILIFQIVCSIILAVSNSVAEFQYRQNTKLQWTL